MLGKSKPEQCRGAVVGARVITTKVLRPGQPVFAPDQCFFGLIQCHLEASVRKNKFNEFFRVHASLLQDVGVGRTLPEQYFEGFFGWIPEIWVVNHSTVERHIRNRAKVSIGERKPAGTVIPCHNNECVRMALLKFQAPAHGVIELQDFLQHGARIVRMPAKVDAPAFHEHEESFIPSRQDIERCTRHLGQGRNTRDIHVWTVDDIRQVAGREHTEEFRCITCSGLQ